MKYLIASEGESLESSVSSHFGGAAFYIIYDDETKTQEVKVHDASVDPHLVIRDTAKSGTKRIICGAIGPDAFQIAKKFEVQVFTISDTSASEALKLAAVGKLPIANGPTVHHGAGGHHHHSHH